MKSLGQSLVSTSNSLFFSNTLEKFIENIFVVNPFSNTQGETGEETSFLSCTFLWSMWFDTHNFIWSTTGPKRLWDPCTFVKKKKKKKKHWRWVLKSFPPRCTGPIYHKMTNERIVVLWSVRLKNQGTEKKVPPSRTPTPCERRKERRVTGENLKIILWRLSKF